MTLIDAYKLPPAAELVANGFEGGLGYLFDLDRALVDDYHAHGLAVGVLAEYDTTRHHPVLDGPTAGMANGADAARRIRALGAPTWVGVIITADTDVQPPQYPIVAAYADAFTAEQDPGRPVGVYGGTDLTNWLCANGHCSYAVITGATAWSHQPPGPDALLLQHIPGPLGGTDGDTYLNGHTVSSCHLWTAQPPDVEARMLDVTTNNLGRQELFEVHPDGSVTHAFQDPHTGDWSDDAPFAPPKTLDPTKGISANNPGGRVEVYGKNPQGQRVHTYQETPLQPDLKPVAWSGWTATF
jgi:hypothetical protein